MRHAERNGCIAADFLFKSGDAAICMQTVHQVFQGQEVCKEVVDSLHYPPWCMCDARRFKHSLLPALISMCLDVDSNIFLLRMENKVSYIVKYLQLHLRQMEELNRPPLPLTTSTSSSSSISSSAASTSSPPASASSPKVNPSVQLSQVLPVDLWNISLITLSSWWLCSLEIKESVIKLVNLWYM